MASRTRFPNSPRRTTKPGQRSLVSLTKPSGVGRKTLYRKEILQEVYNYCVLGATDTQVADALGISIQTVELWKRTRPDFRKAMELGKVQADALVVQSLFHKAIGYKHKDVQFFNHQGKIISQEYMKHYPPDTTAAIFWLKNRQRELWVDISDVRVKHSGQIQHKKVEELDISKLSKEEQDLLFNLNLKQLTKDVGRN